jgi:CheY-like chemotaxis protein
MAKKILIVEDNPQNMKLVLMTLESRGYEIIKATDGEEALKVAEKERPDLILMDIQLPKMDGLEVTRRLKQMPAFSHIPIIAITAHAMKGDEQKIAEAGCNAYITKPFSTRELPKLVAKMLEQHQKV